MHHCTWLTEGCEHNLSGVYYCYSCVWTKCATTARLLASTTVCLLGIHAHVRRDYIKLSLTHTHSHRRVLSSPIFHLLSDRLMSSDIAGVDMSPWAVTVVTENPAPGQAVTGSSPAATVSQKRTEKCRYTCFFVRSCAWVMAALFSHISFGLCFKINKVKHD